MDLKWTWMHGDNFGKHCMNVWKIYKHTACAGLLIGCDEKSEILQHFQGRLHDKIGLLCDKLCDFGQC